MKRIETLVISILCFMIAVCCLLKLLGCSIAFGPNCLDSALLAAETFRNQGYEVRLAYGKDDMQYHIIAQAMIKGKWECLKVDRIYT